MESVLNYVVQGSNVYCATVGRSQAYDQNNIYELIRKLGFSILPERIVDIIDFIGKNTMVNVFLTDV